MKKRNTLATGDSVKYPGLQYSVHKVSDFFRKSEIQPVFAAVSHKFSALADAQKKKKNENDNSNVILPEKLHAYVIMTFQNGVWSPPAAAENTDERQNEEDEKGGGKAEKDSSSSSHTNNNNSNTSDSCPLPSSGPSSSSSCCGGGVQGTVAVAAAARAAEGEEEQKEEENGSSTLSSSSSSSSSPARGLSTASNVKHLGASNVKYSVKLSHVRDTTTSAAALAPQQHKREEQQKEEEEDGTGAKDSSSSRRSKAPSLIEYSDDATEWKDESRLVFWKWAAEVFEQLDDTTVSIDTTPPASEWSLFDWVDPATGLPCGTGACGPCSWNEAEAVEHLVPGCDLVHVGTAGGGCRLIVHPQFGENVYPATAVVVLPEYAAATGDDGTNGREKHENSEADHQTSSDNKNSANHHAALASFLSLLRRV